MRYLAPPDVSGITLSTGPLTVVEGYIDVPDDASQGDLGGLAVYGFTAAPETTPQPRASKATTAPAPTPEEPDNTSTK